MFGRGTHWLSEAIERLEREDDERKARIAAAVAKINARATLGTAGLTASELGLIGARGPDGQVCYCEQCVSGTEVDDGAQIEPLPAGFGVHPASERVEARRKGALAQIESWLRFDHENRVCNVMLAADGLDLTMPDPPDFAVKARELLEIGTIDAALVQVAERFQ